MIEHHSLLVKLLLLIDQIPLPSLPAPQRRGRPTVYSDRLFLKALLIMIARRLNTIYELVSVLNEPEMHPVRECLHQNGRLPCRRTFERRLGRLPERLPAQILCLGGYLVALINPFAHSGRAAAIDSTVLRANGGLWHKKDREQGRVPHSSIDTEANWTKSGWHGWVYGWKLHLTVTVASVWIPLSASLTAANEADNTVAPALIEPLPEQVRFVLGDLHYNAPEVDQACQAGGRILVTPLYGAYPHQDEGVEVRRLFHKLRSLAIENFNEHFKGIFGGHGQVPTKGLVRTSRFGLGAVFVYQVALLYRFRHGLPLNLGLKAFLHAA